MNDDVATRVSEPAAAAAGNRELIAHRRLIDGLVDAVITSPLTTRERERERESSGRTAARPGLVF